MAWRRLASYYSNTARFELSRAAATQAFRYADRLGENEKQLTIAAYYTNGPEHDEEKALAAYEALIARDSLNSTALNNASVLLGRRRETEKSLEYYMRSARLPGRTPLSFQNAAGMAIHMGRWELVDSLQRESERAYPANPLTLVAPSRVAASRGDFDRAAQLSAEVVPRIAASRSTLIGQRNFDAQLALTRGKVRESLGHRAEQRQMQAQAGLRQAALNSGLDSVQVTALVLEDPARARSLLDRTLKRAPIDSIPYLDRNYEVLLAVAAQIGDTAHAREWYVEGRKSWEAFGNSIDRAAIQASNDAMMAMAFGRYADALVALQEADRLKHPRYDILAANTFHILDRLKMTDSAIAAGEKYITMNHFLRLSQDAFYLGPIRQRLGELYEGKGDFDKALTQYQAFVELWKDADPELQARVRDVRSRVERIQRRRG